MSEIKARLGKGGRLVLPVKYRRTLGVSPGDEVIMILEGEEIRILTRQQAIRRAQSLVKRHVAEGRRLSDELIKERRAEAAHE
jgi:bifunctional DNA-binding transcriptional regulator/antitoxin component of YhaV-PrlF toxin-antitoxin module